MKVQNNKRITINKIYLKFKVLRNYFDYDSDYFVNNKKFKTQNPWKS